MFAYCNNNPINFVDFGGDILRSHVDDANDLNDFFDDATGGAGAGGSGTYHYRIDTSIALRSSLWTGGLSNTGYMDCSYTSGPNKGTQGKASTKTVDELISNLPDTTSKKGVARNLESTGGYKQTVEDFYSLSPTDVKTIDTKYGSGFVGSLEGGGTLVARPGSATGGATLEIRISNSRVYKIRYSK